MGGHNTDSIFKNREVLLPNFIPFNMSQRADELETINRIINESMEGKITNVLISGPPGSGKTASIKLIFGKLKDQYNALFCYINCFNKSTRMGVLYAMVIEFYKKVRPTRKMPSRRGIAYDELLDSFKTELEKNNLKIVVCLDEIDKLEEAEIIYDLTTPTWNSSRIQIIGISNNPLIFKKLDPRTKSRLFPVEEIYFNPYTQEELKTIIKAKVEEAFKEGVVEKEVIDFLAKYTFEKKGDVRIVKQTLLCSGDLAINLDDKRVELCHVKEKLNRTSHAKSIRLINELSQHEQFILKLIPNQGTYYPKLYDFYKSTDGKLGDRMFRNYIERFYKLKLINIEKKGVGGSYFITLNTPKNVLFEIS